MKDPEVDLQSKGPTAASLPKDILSFEDSHVHEVYDSIATHFSSTRYAPWPAVASFVSSLPKYSLVADVGCGNGKYLSKNDTRHLFFLGTDRCAPLTAIAGQRDKEEKGEGFVEVATADCLTQPMRTGVFDAAISIAVVHHLVGRHRRCEAWAEIGRLLHTGGRGLVYVWAIERKEKIVPRKKHGQKMLSRRFDSQDVMVPWCLRKKKEGATDERILGETSKVLQRYYHVYREGELEDELKAVHGIKLVESYYDHQNWCAIIERTPGEVEVR